MDNSLGGPPTAADYAAHDALEARRMASEALSATEKYKSAYERAAYLKNSAELMIEKLEKLEKEIKSSPDSIPAQFEALRWSITIERAKLMTANYILSN